MKLTIEQTKIIKGIAILMMVFLHLFNHLSDVELCSYFFTIGDVPLVHWLTRAANPVPFYLFLSGYGLYYSWMSGKELNPWRRCLKLYQVYWLSLLVMVGLGFLVKPTAYPGSLMAVIDNISGWKTSYNAEAWFIFPYLLLVLSAKWLFSLVDRQRSMIIGVLVFALYLVAAYIISKASRSGNDWLFNTMWAYHPILYIECLCPFFFGAIACKTSNISRTIYQTGIFNRNWVAILLLLILVIARCLVNTDAFSPVYALLVIIIFSRIQWSGWLKRLLQFFGQHSTTMWLTHSYFCYYLFHDFIYSFRYPLLIYMVTIGCALFASFVIQNLCRLCRLSQ